jgi:hypothetical protein
MNKLRDHHVDPGDITVRPAHVGNEADLNRIRVGNEDDRDRRGRSLRPKCRTRSVSGDDRDTTIDQIGDQFRLSTGLIGCPAVVPVGNLRSEILVVQSAQNWHRQGATDSLDGTRGRRVLVQR